MVTEPIRILVIEDEEDMRFLMRTVIAQAGDDVVVVGEATNADDGLARWQELRPDVVVIDYLMPGRNGLDVASEILDHDGEQAIILFTAHIDPATSLAADVLGIRQVVRKDRVRELPTLIRANHPG